MHAKLFLFVASASIATPAFAGFPVPAEEAGMGLAAMLIIGSGYAYLRRRAKR